MIALRRFLAACGAVVLMAGPSEPGHFIGDYPRDHRAVRPPARQDHPARARMEKLAEGYDWSEGPVWDRKGGFLLFSDVPMNTVFQWTAGASKPSVFLKPSGYTGSTPRGGEPGSNGLLMDSQGRLVLCQHGDRRVARLEADGTFTTLADRYEGKRFNSPNDGVYQLQRRPLLHRPALRPARHERRPAKELRFQRRLPALAEGKLTLLTKEMTYPNGIALLARREDPLRRQLRSQEGDLDGLPGEG